jgi:hypothetical protein
MFILSQIAISLIPKPPRKTSQPITTSPSKAAISPAVPASLFALPLSHTDIAKAQLT